jgi:hypothetical protein
MDEIHGGHTAFPFGAFHAQLLGRMFANTCFRKCTGASGILSMLGILPVRAGWVKRNETRDQA